MNDLPKYRTEGICNAGLSPYSNAIVNLLLEKYPDKRFKLADSGPAFLWDSGVIGREGYHNYESVICLDFGGRLNLLRKLFPRKRKVVRLSYLHGSPVEPNSTEITIHACDLISRVEIERLAKEVEGIEARKRNIAN